MRRQLQRRHAPHSSCFSSFLEDSMKIPRVSQSSLPSAIAFVLVCAATPALAGNSVTGTYAVVAGGDLNTASGGYAVVAGGSQNTASGPIGPPF